MVMKRFNKLLDDAAEIIKTNAVRLVKEEFNDDEEEKEYSKEE
jgi:hypothetical protein